MRDTRIPRHTLRLTQTAAKMNAGGVGVLLPPLVAIAGIVAAWVVAIAVTRLPPFILPTPWQVMVELWSDRAILLPAALSTISISLMGLMLAVLFAFLSSMVMDLFPAVLRAWYPLVVLSQTVQILAVAPLIILWFGFGVQSTLIIVVLFCFFPINIALVNGFQNTPSEYTRQFRALRANRWQMWRFVRLPAALPSFFAGIRVGAAYAVISATIGEWVGGSGGLGVYILRSKNALQTAQVFAGMLLCSLLSMALFAAVVTIERTALARYTQHRKETI